MERKWVMEIHGELEALPEVAVIESSLWSKRSIYKIPAFITDLNKSAYQPQIASIGPYHHGAEHLMAMEEHKHRALLRFLRRSRVHLGTIFEALVPMFEDLKDAYDQLDSKWHQNGDEFLKLMILDGCFTLEILSATIKSGASYQSSNDPDYAPNDPVFSRLGSVSKVPYLKRDMLLLENQIPMSVLQILIGFQNDASLKEQGNLLKLILKFLSQPVSNKDLNQFHKCLHILDVYRKSLLLREPTLQQKGGKRSKTQRGGDEIISSAMELFEAGIGIERSKTKSLNDISFQKGVLKLPPIVVDDVLESLYLNLIQFEKFHVGLGNEVTAYVLFMYNIIENATDVSLLRWCGIIQNALGSNKAVADLFNSLSKDLILYPDSSLNDVYEEVSAYCQKPQRICRAFVVQNVRNIWAVLSVLGAFVLFALTLLQTVYTVMGYGKPNS